MKNVFFRVAFAIGFSSVSAISMADTLMAYDHYYGGNWTNPDCNWTSSVVNTSTTRTLSCYGEGVLNYTYTTNTNSNGAKINLLNPQLYYVTSSSSDGPVAVAFDLYKKAIISNLKKPVQVVTPGIVINESIQNYFPFRVLNAPKGATYEILESVTGTPDRFITSRLPLPEGKIDSQSGMSVTTLTPDLNFLDLNVKSKVILRVFDQNGLVVASGSAIAHEASSMPARHQDALNAFYVNRAGQNIVDYQSGTSRSGKVRAAGNLFSFETASMRTNKDHHDNPAPKCQTMGNVYCPNVDVTGGWFDAGDQGKYVQNAAVSLWHLFNIIERDMPLLIENPGDTSVQANNQKKIWQTGYSTIPENPNSLTVGSTYTAVSATTNELPNIIKEARYEMEWLLKMQINNPYLKIELPLGNQDVPYNSTLGHGVRSVTTVSHQYNNYQMLSTGSQSSSLYDPGSNRAIPLYEQKLKYTYAFVDGMVYHSVHDDDWTDIPMLPQNNNKKRVLEYPTSAATLSFAAIAAQCYRVFKEIDSNFANTCWNASTKAFNAYKPDNQLVYFYGEYSNSMNAPLASIVKGAGAYADLRLNDLVYWANMERYLSTVKLDRTETAGARNYLRNINSLSDVAPSVSGKFPIKSANWLLGYNWSNAAALGSLSAITVNPEKFAKAKVRIVTDEQNNNYVDIDSPATNLMSYVNNTLAPNAQANPWGLPLPSNFVFEWGSNHEIINAGILAKAAYRLHVLDQQVNELPPLKAEAYLIPENIVFYMLGSNPLNLSMVTGNPYVNSADNIHHRVFAKQADSSTISTPAGWLVGGANGQIPQAVLSAGREQGTLSNSSVVPDRGVFNGGRIKQAGGALGGYKQLMEVLPSCRETDGTVRSAMCHSNNYWSYHTNEVAINWHASWLWLSSAVRNF